jgi:ribonucleoside-diphosphate reductase alpha chain
MSEMSFFAKSIMEQKYAHELEDGRKETWSEIADRVSHHVLKALNIRKNYIDDVKEIIEKRQFMPGGRYLYAVGRPYHQVQNCLLLRAEDSREGWADLLQKSSMALMTGAGIGVDYSHIRPEGKPVRKTGGVATGPLALMQMLNECGRGIMQGGSRRCLPDDTMVTMSDYTEKRIADIKIDDEVLTRFGAKKVTNVFDQGYQPVIKIETELGSIRTTGNHKLLTSTRSRTKTFYSPTSALNLDCKLYKVLVPTYTGGNDIDLGYAYVLGFYLGDGCSHSSGRTNEVTFQVDKPKYNQKQVNKICNTLNEMGYKTAVRKGHGECTEIRCQSIDAYNYFVEFKKPNTPFSIPENILNASLESRRAFMAGWFDADGYLGKAGFKLANTHESVRKEAKDFLEKLGFYITESGIELRLSSYQKQYFIESIGKYMFKKTRFGVHKSTSEIPVNIISISKEIAQVHTFDIEVEDVHEFIADGFVSHNSAIWAGLNWKHADAHKFVAMKNWIPEVRSLKDKDFNFPATMDGTNISIQLDDEFFKAFGNEKSPLHSQAQSIYWAVVRQMLKTAEPGFSVDVGVNSGETLRNACTEVTSNDDSDICNLGSINLARINSLEEMKKVTELATLFLLAGTVYSHVPYSKVDEVRTRNRRLGLGLMGLHEWLLVRGKKYESDPELQKYLEIYATSTAIAKTYADKYDLSAPVKTRAIAPTGTIGIVAETTTGIEPIFCVAYKRRYKKGSDMNAFQYVIDPTAKKLIDKGVNSDHIEDAYVLADDIERRISFQAWVQEYVDHSISSTLNIPSWGSEKNNDNTVQSFGNMLIKHLPKLRGITCYPDGARGGQPLTPVRYLTAAKHVGEVFYESADVCDITRAGSCGS